MTGRGGVSVSLSLPLESLSLNKVHRSLSEVEGGCFSHQGGIWGRQGQKRNCEVWLPTVGGGRANLGVSAMAQDVSVQFSGEGPRGDAYPLTLRNGSVQSNVQ